MSLIIDGYNLLNATTIAGTGPNRGTLANSRVSHCWTSSSKWFRPTSCHERPSFSTREKTHLSGVPGGTTIAV